MVQNDNLKLFINKSGKNYTINNQSITRRLETLTSLMDIDNPNTKYDAAKKRKFNALNSYLSLADLDEPHDKQLSKIPVSNSFNKLQEVDEVLPGNDRTERNNPKPKSPSIYIEAQVIAPLIDLLKEIAKDEYTLKQLKYNHVNTSDTYRKVTKALKEKNANFYTYQPKKDKS
ncbi:hypothetical protein HZH66_014658 [Vespula vulgaris]|uniref:Uncharacterized protein n=1 Tax=Vespula vulgaris TaxID=7454 RepID=A0A834J1S5_VESVU|nr:hypothetical protein HZH66_014658 [Vespula vulgaris]